MEQAVTSKNSSFGKRAVVVGAGLGTVALLPRIFDAVHGLMIAAGGIGNAVPVVNFATNTLHCLDNRVTIGATIAAIRPKVH